MILIEGSGRVTDKICYLRRNLKACAKNMLLKHLDKKKEINSVASAVAALGGGASIMLGEHAHDTSSILQGEDDEDIREIASSGHVYMFPITGASNDLAKMIIDLLEVVWDSKITEIILEEKMENRIFFLKLLLKQLHSVPWNT